MHAVYCYPELTVNTGKGYDNSCETGQARGESAVRAVFGIVTSP